MEKKSVVVGVKREQVTSNDPLLDPLRSFTSPEPETYESDIPRAIINQRPTSSSIPESNNNTGIMSDLSEQRNPFDKIDVMVDKFVRSCRFELFYYFALQ